MSYGLTYSAEMRYRGQSFEIDTPLDPAAIEACDLEAGGRRSIVEHERIYGHSDSHAAIQIVTVRLVISGKTAKPEIPKRQSQPGPAQPASEIDVYLDRKKRRVGLYTGSRSWPGRRSTARRSWRRMTARQSCRPASRSR